MPSNLIQCLKNLYWSAYETRTDIDEQATAMMFRLVEQMANKEGVTEQLKAEKTMLWVGKMNEIQARAREIINTEIIYA